MGLLSLTQYVSTKWTYEYTNKYLQYCQQLLTHKNYCTLHIMVNINKFSEVPCDMTKYIILW